MKNDRVAVSDAGEPSTYLRPVAYVGSLSDVLYVLRTVRGVDTNGAFSDAYGDVLRRHARRAVLHGTGRPVRYSAVHRPSAAAARLLRRTRRAAAASSVGPVFWG